MQCSESYLPLTEQQCLFVLQISGGTFQTQAAACVVSAPCIYWDKQFAVISRSAGIVSQGVCRQISRVWVVACYYCLLGEVIMEMELCAAGL